LDVKIDAKSIPEPMSGCILWLGSLYENGYGVLHYKGMNLKAHRANYELTHGSVPDGMVLDHLCRVRSCIRVDHLEVVTQRENVRRGSRMNLQDECMRGHPFSTENTYVTVRKDGRTHRQCRACKALRAS
jgi:hypothetical protein